MLSQDDFQVFYTIIEDDSIDSKDKVESLFKFSLYNENIVR